MKKRIWLVAIGTGLLGVVLVIAAGRGHTDTGADTARQSARWFAGQVEQTLARYALETRSFTVSEAVKSGDPARLIPYLNALTGTYGGKFGAMLVMNRRGKVIAANTSDAQGAALGNDGIFARDLSGTAWFAKAVEDLSRCRGECVSFGEVLDADEVSSLFHQTNRFLTVAAPIRHPRTNEMLGLWVNRIPWDVAGTQWADLAKRALAEKAQLALTDGKGKFFFGTDGNATAGWDTFRFEVTAPVRRSGNWETAVSLEGSGLPAWTVVSRVPASAGGQGAWPYFAALAFGLVALLSGGTVRRSLGAFDQVFFAINDQADHLKSAASQLTSCSQDLAQSATEQASSLQQTASSIDEINSMVNQSAENAERSAKIASDSQETAARGRAVVDDMIRAIGEISTSNGSILKQVEAGNQQLTDIIKVIAEIGNKTKIINDIAFQTKLLSFNASVEAARAGEHGKGFAVVAEEVGSLANMSANAAKEINDMLAGSIQTVQSIVESSRGRVEALIADGKSKIEGGIQVARQCETVLEEIVKAEAQMNAIINQIAGAAREQAQGIGEITKAIGMLDATTNRNASIATQTEEFAEAIASLALALKDEVVGFRHRMNGNSGHGGGSVEFVDSPGHETPFEATPEDFFANTGEPAMTPSPNSGGEGDPMALAAVFGEEAPDKTPDASAFVETPAPPTPAATAGKVIPLRPSRLESPLRSASTESLEETPSESDPRFKEV